MSNEGREAIILAGGLGSRLRTIIREVPKPMAPVDGRPFLEYLLDWLISRDFSHVILSVGYLGETIIEHFSDSYKNIELSYAIENQALGTGGGIALALEKSRNEHVFVFNGDTLFLAEPEDLEKAMEEIGADAVLALRQVDDATRYGSVQVNEEGEIIRFVEKGEAKGPGVINGGIYLVHRELFHLTGLHGRFSIEKDCFEQHVKDLDLAGIVSNQYFIDIGVPEDFHRAQTELPKLNY